MQTTSNHTSYQQMKSADNQDRDILNHRKAATFLAKAVRLHMEAAKQRMEGNREKEAECSQLSQELLFKVTEMQKED